MPRLHLSDSGSGVYMSLERICLWREIWLWREYFSAETQLERSWLCSDCTYCKRALVFGDFGSPVTELKRHCLSRVGT
jgi:hypothetical protein